MTFNHSATTRRYRWSGPTHTPLCWTQPQLARCSCAQGSCVGSRSMPG